MENILAVYPKASNTLGLWAGRPTLRHDCGCESQCGQVFVYFLTPEEKLEFTAGKQTFQSLLESWKERGDDSCFEQQFIIQALVDAQIPPEEWEKYTQRLEEINAEIGGFKLRHIEKLRPDIFDPRDRFYDPPLIKEVRRYLAQTA
ncbi:hypothetical protein KBA63_05670 [Candidatus Woesebacteria bacterium]|nr:hypothetical protein [Candidatus Woesebacteria bacterium]MBP9687738.1 hypothetical protein [Candidatus Woesebacteria bacterium]